MTVSLQDLVFRGCHSSTFPIMSLMGHYWEGTRMAGFNME